jgi:hypothetical protein
MRGPEGTPQGVRPTINAESHLSGKVSDIGMPACPTSDSCGVFDRAPLMKSRILWLRSGGAEAPRRLGELRSPGQAEACPT